MSAAGTPVYDSSRSRLRFAEEARELWSYRHFVFELASRDIKVRYKRSVLGVAWTMLSPLMAMVVFTLVFSTFQRLPIPGYPVYYLSAAIFWTFFSQVTSHVGSLTTDALEIANRIYIPRSVFVASAVVVGLVNLLLSLVPFALIILVTGRPAHWTWLFLPVSLVIGTLFTAGVGLLMFTLALRFVDVRDMYQAVLLPWFFVTPILWSTATLGDRAEQHHTLLQVLHWVNPVAPPIFAVRDAIWSGHAPHLGDVVYAIVAACIALVLGAIVFRSVDDRIAVEL